ncbi:unnamed protein product [Allacma fusca]|uniref:Saccharopine dehydrogenase NADP binding domain-containing protein n=1 Tax=Allacma fusca TaxID=39272 RepID=A0A8J2PBR0_9HEXA|nr:unnamed protein product [Allacma fusca]
MDPVTTDPKRMARKYDLIIYGASGFTGKCTVLELVKLLQNNKIDKVSWAIGGRSGEKLKAVLNEVSAETGEDLRQIEVIQADVENPESLQVMARQVNVILTCVGPYRFFGEAIVKACIAESTNYVDVCGEPQFLEEMQLRYHQQALEKNIYIVGSCGLDTIPSDCGIALLQQKFEGEVNSVEMYLEVINKGVKPMKINYGTWQSAIHGLAHASELRGLRSLLFTKPLPKPTFKLRDRGTLHYSDVINGWCLPFPGADPSVVKRSQYYFFHEEQRRPAQIRAYFKSGSLFPTAVIILVGLIFGIFSRFKAGRHLLEKYPEFFSLGAVTRDGMSKDEMDDAEFKVTLKGEGWSRKLTGPTDQHAEPPREKMDVIVFGRNPGYGATCIMLIQAAYTILKEAEKLPSTGGVYPPGAAFARTTLVDRLTDSGVTFTVHNHSEISTTTK